MKKLLLAVLFLGGMTAQGNTVTDLDHTTERGSRYNQPQSITFIERGVEFVVFTNGQFDFTSIRQGVQRQGRRGFGYNAPGHTYGVTYPYNNNRGFVKYNRYGDIYQVGRNYVDYNRNGKVNQIGSVDLRYKKGRLVRVGNMRVVYNRRGQIVDLIGNINYDNRDYRRNQNDWYGKNNKNIKKIKKITAVVTKVIPTITTTTSR